VIEGDLLEGSLAFAQACDFENLPALAQDRVIDAVGADFWATAEAALLKRVRDEAAPLRALACIKAATERGFTEALAFERETFLDLRGSRQASALRHVFFCERAAPRPSELNGITARPVRTVGVIGGGTMGAGIAAACRDAGLPVILIEQDKPALERGLANLSRIYEGAVIRGRISALQAEDKIKGVAGYTDMAALADADLVIEAVFEDMAVKRGVFARLVAHCRSDTILATNTSYLDPRMIFVGLPHQDRFLGLHFFSPAQVMKLLEIVPTVETDPTVLAAGFALARSMN
jgi:3-hydroxyacyl-CoA dehydrogenase